MCWQQNVNKSNDLRTTKKNTKRFYIDYNVSCFTHWITDFFIAIREWITSKRRVDNSKIYLRDINWNFTFPIKRSISSLPDIILFENSLRGACDIYRRDAAACYYEIFRDSPWFLSQADSRDFKAISWPVRELDAFWAALTPNYRDYSFG
jgi:hypothetical protein